MQFKETDQGKTIRHVGTGQGKYYKTMYQAFKDGRPWGKPCETEKQVNDYERDNS